MAGTAARDRSTLTAYAEETGALLASSGTVNGARAERKSARTETEMIRVRRVYEPVDVADGTRFLVERLWPRGTRKEALALDDWLKDVAPSTALRQWFGHDPAKWEEFRQRYTAELDAQPTAWQPILDATRANPVTLLFSSHDLEHNNAVALKAYLDARLRGDSRSPRSRRRQADSGGIATHGHGSKRPVSD